MIYKSIHRGTDWKYIRRTCRACGRIMIKLQSVEGNIILMIEEKDFLEQFIKAED